MSELISTALDKFTFVTGIQPSKISLEPFTYQLGQKLYATFKEQNNQLGVLIMGKVEELMNQKVLNDTLSPEARLTNLALMVKGQAFERSLMGLVNRFNQQLASLNDDEREIMTLDFCTRAVPGEFGSVWAGIDSMAKQKVAASQLHQEIRLVVLFLINLMNQTKSNEHYDTYTHSVIALTEAEFARQNSNMNEMVQHGISLHKQFDVKNHPLASYNSGALKWIADLMSECGVVGTEQNVQTHTRIATDAKKREFPFFGLAAMKNQATKKKNRWHWPINHPMSILKF
jgi:hypothetical protein